MVTEHLPSILGVLGSVPSTTNKTTDQKMFISFDSKILTQGIHSKEIIQSMCGKIFTEKIIY